MNRSAAAIAMVVLVAASAVPTAAVATQNGTGTQEASAYSGTHVTFDVQDSAVVDYQVEGETVLDSVKVQSESSGNAGAVFDGSLDLSALANVEGSALSMNAQTSASAEIGAEGSASMTAHDNDHGILVVESGGDGQAVVANVSSDAEASAESDQQVEVTTESGAKGTFVVVGDGSVTVNDDGNVAAKLNGDARLVLRSYPEEKTETDEQTEAYIASGEAAAEVYVEQQDGELVTDTVTYGQETTVETKTTAENAVNVTIDRAASEGKVVVTSVSEAAVGTTEDVSVTVDGEAAAQASSYSELEGAIGSDTSKYMVEQSSSAEASADVYVAVNHFSERTVQMQGGEGGSDSSDGDTGSDDSGSSGGSVPGFGVGVALVAALGAALVALRE